MADIFSIYIINYPIIMFSKYSMTFALFTAGQVEAIRNKREPLLTWGPTNKKSHPMDYPVPSYGADPDMYSNDNSLRIA